MINTLYFVTPKKFDIDQPIRIRLGGLTRHQSPVSQ